MIHQALPNLIHFHNIHFWLSEEYKRISTCGHHSLVMYSKIITIRLLLSHKEGRGCFTKLISELVLCCIDLTTGHWTWRAPRYFLKMAKGRETLTSPIQCLISQEFSWEAKTPRFHGSNCIHLRLIKPAFTSKLIFRDLVPPCIWTHLDHSSQIPSPYHLISNLSHFNIKSHSS